MMVQDPAGQARTIPLIQWVWGSYFRTALIPLLLVEVVFIGIYLTTNTLATQENLGVVRRIATEELRRIAQREAVVIQKQLESIVQTTDLFRRQTALLLQRPFEPDPDERDRYATSPEGVYHTTRDNGGAALFYSGIVPVGPAQREKVWRTVSLDPLMRDIQQTHPLVVQVYFNAFDSLNRIYPYFDVLSQYQPRMDIPSFNFYYEADDRHNPGRGVVWTDVYVDPAGQGWMLSCIAPVYREDFLEGVVGLDITVATITDSILKLAIPWGGYGVLVGKTGTLLALPPAGESDWGLRELTDHTYDDYIRQDTFKPESFNLYRRAGFEVVQVHAEGITALDLKGTQLAAWATIPETGWKLLVMVRESNLYAQANQLGHRLMVIGLWMIAGLILFYTVFFVILYRRARTMAGTIAEPLQTIDALVARIGQGDWVQSVPRFKVCELQQTAAGLVDMGQQLGEANRALRLARQEAEQSRDQALESVRLKSEFLATISHELRTPLNGVLGMLDLLLDTPLAAEQHRFGVVARDSGHHLLRIIDDILALSQLEAGRTRLSVAPFSPRDLVDDVVASLRPKAQARQLELTVDLSSDVPALVCSDAGRLRQVLQNLLDNAVKFTERGRVDVRCAPDRTIDRRQWLEFSVTDTGIGIPDAAHGRLFQPFTQVDGSDTRRFGGTGVGLNLCKRLVDLMGGEIGFETAVDVGSTFWFRVPLDCVERDFVAQSLVSDREPAP